MYIFCCSKKYHHKIEYVIKLHTYTYIQYNGTVTHTNKYIEHTWRL